TSAEGGQTLTFVTAKGQAAILLAEGKTLRLGITNAPGGSGILVQDKEGKPRAKLLFEEADSTAKLVLTGGGNKHAITLGSSSEFATLHLRDSKGVTRIAAECADSPVISTFDADGK